MSNAETKLYCKFWFTVGESNIRFTPSGMWGHKVWQNAGTYVCSGIKRDKDNEYEWRFTKIGDNSIPMASEDKYEDVFIKECWLIDPLIDDRCEASEVKLPIGWVKFYRNANKRHLREALKQLTHITK